MVTHLIREIRKSVIFIDTSLKFGTGFFIDDQGTAVTCRHVIETSDKRGIIQSGVAYVLSSNSVQYHPMIFKVLRTERIYDLAIIKVHGGPFRGLKLDDNFGRRIAGEEIGVFGFPFVPYLNHPSLTKGIISAIFTDPHNEVDMIQTDVWIYEASSGSPCFLTNNGVVIGYATSSFDPIKEHQKGKGINVRVRFSGIPYNIYTNMCFVIPAKYIMNFSYLRDKTT